MWHSATYNHKEKLVTLDYSNYLLQKENGICKHSLKGSSRRDGSKWWTLITEGCNTKGQCANMSVPT